MLKILTQNHVHISRTLWIICLFFVGLGSISPGNPDFQPVWGSDKLLHLIAYAWLAALQPLFASGKKQLALLVAFITVFGVAMEGIQALVPDRYPSLGDIIANTSGVALGTWLGVRLREALQRVTTRS